VEILDSGQDGARRLRRDRSRKDDGSPEDPGSLADVESLEDVEPLEDVQSLEDVESLDEGEARGGSSSADRGSGPAQQRRRLTLAAVAVAGALVGGLVVDSAGGAGDRAAEQPKPVQSGTVQLSIVGSPQQGDFGSRRTPQGRPVLVYQVTLLNGSSSQVEVLDVDVPEQEGIRLTRAPQLAGRSVAPHDRADLLLGLAIDCADPPQRPPLVRVVAHTGDNRPQTVEAPAVEVTNRIDEVSSLTCEQQGSPPSTVVFVGAQPAGARRWTLSFRVTGAPEARLAQLRMIAAGIEATPRAPLPVPLTGAAPLQVDLDARIVDCPEALATSQTPRFRAAIEATGGREEAYDVTPNDPDFVAAVLRMVFRSCP
jgi:hypothetical protein